MNSTVNAATPNRVLLAALTIASTFSLVISSFTTLKFTIIPPNEKEEDLYLLLYKVTIISDIILQKHYTCTSIIFIQIIYPTQENCQ